MILRALLQSELNAYEFGVDGGFWVERRAREQRAAIALLPSPTSHVIH
jgi:hypothetical protein